MAAVLPLTTPRVADWPEPQARQPGLGRCLLLAALVHLLLVLLLGTVSGTAPPGEGVFGTLNVRLAGGGPAAEEAPRPTPPAAYTGPSGQAEDRRWGGAVRERPPTAAQAETPGAAREGTYNPLPTVHSADPLPPQSPPAAEAPPPLRQLGAPPEAPPLNVDQPLAPAPPPLASPLPPVAPVPELAPLPPTVRTLAPPAPPAAAPDARPLSRLAPLEAPALPGPAAAPASLPEAPPQPTRTLTPPPALAPTTTPAPLRSVRPLEDVPLPPPARAPAPLPPAAATTPEPAPTQAPPASPAPPAPTPPTAAAAPTPVAPATTPAAPGTNPAAPAQPSFGAPDAGAQVGHDIATPATAPASAPRLNLDLPRPRGGELSRSGSKGMLNLLPPPPERKDKLADGIEKAAKSDCRNAYSGLGVLAVVPLAADAVRKDGCRW